ncbi:MMPL family transporter [Spongiibacter sp. KMU-158]|uniref:MMPL family transporter n=1 Tax=Spongiibacter pelagi TaxID=2760804 RepID=A0A927GW81_9GAMM|nr:MMPL family transporter [Spongiibacter pelagi]MBD2858858.1 MMPL family transporter [Spongiibacter pelagi]
MNAIVESLYQKILLRHAALAMVILVAVLGWLGSYIPSLKLDASSEALVLEGDTSLAYYRQIVKRYGSEDFLVVTYRPNGFLLADRQLQTIDAMRAKFAALPGVSGVTTILDVPLLDSPRVGLSQVTGGDIPTLRDPKIDRELALKEFTSSPIYRQLLTSIDGKTTVLQVNLQRDEKYFELMNIRNDLRDAARMGDIESELKLHAAEKAFADYTAEAHERSEELVASARGIIEEYRGDAQLFLGGVPMITVDMIDFVKGDLKLFGTGILLFIVAMLAVIFRSLRWVLIPLSTCLGTVVFMLGLLGFLDWRLTVISANFVALLLILTLAITIHLVVRYRELANEFPKASQYDIVLQTVQKMLRPCLYTALTTLVAFASLVVSGIRPVIDFGWMMTMGVLAALVMAFVILPCVLMLLPRKEERGGEASKTSFTLMFAKATEHYGGVIIVVSVLLLALSGWGISQLKVENRFIDYFHDTTEIYQGMETIDSELGGTIGLDIILDMPKPTAEVEVDTPVASATAPAADLADDEFANDDFAGDDFADDPFATDPFAEDFGGSFGSSASTSDSYWFTVAGLKRIQEVHDYMDGLEETGKVLSLATFYEVMQMVMGNVDDLQLALAARSLPESINEILIDPYLSVEADQARISLRVKETSRTLHRNELLKQVRAHLIDDLGFEPEQVHLTGMLVLYNNMLQSLFKSQILTLSAVFVAILAMFMVLFRSFSLALIALTPNLLAAGAVLGGMGLAGIPLDMMTITIAAITVGIGVDDTIHYVHRFISEFPKDRNYLQTMYRCHGSIGRAMYYTSVIIIFGFSILMLSNFTPSIYFGLLTALAMIAALAGAMLLLPKLVLVFKPLGPEGVAADVVVKTAE